MPKQSETNSTSPTKGYMTPSPVKGIEKRTGCKEKARQAKARVVQQDQHGHNIGRITRRRLFSEPAATEATEDDFTQHQFHEPAEGDFTRRLLGVRGIIR